MLFVKLCLIVGAVAAACIVNVKATDSKIVGGTDAPEKYPYQISLQIKPPFFIALFTPTSPGGWAHNCGGSIVTERHVVTAAHCLTGYNASSLSVWAGTQRLDGDGQRFAVESILIHPDYVELNCSDIGIVTLAKPLTFSNKVKLKGAFNANINIIKFLVFADSTHQI